MRLREIIEHNKIVAARQRLHSQIKRVISDVWAITSNNYLVIIQGESYLSRHGTQIEKVMGCRVVGKIIHQLNRPDKIIPLSKEEEKPFQIEGTLFSKILDNLDYYDYNELDKEFDMSSIPKGSIYRSTDFVISLVDSNLF